jgi:catechol 2,3-dioxygenase-like lactoylglutathione lyase family enzyme
VSYDEPVVNHVGQATADLERAIAFYTGLLSFVVERRFTLPDAPTDSLLSVDEPGLEVAYLRRGAFVLELMQFHRAGNPDRRERVFNEPGLTHLSVSVVDLDATADQVEPLGGQVVSRFPYAVIARDPDGQLIELLTMDYRKQTDAELAAGPR